MDAPGSKLRARMQRAETRLEIVEKLSRKSNVDERFWTPTLDKDGKGSALIRFLPAPDGEVDHFVKVFNHYFVVNGERYIEKCLTTINQKDPAEEYAKKVGGGDKEIYGKFGRKVQFIANIYVVKDPANPEAEGKVFLFKFGNSIMKKVLQLLQGVDDPIDPKDPVLVMDPWEGINFKLIVSPKYGHNNYDDSKFADSPTALFKGDDVKIDELWAKCHSLQQFLQPSNFKTYEELDAKLRQVVGDTSVLPEMSEEEKEVPAAKPAAKPAPAAKKASKPPVKEEDPDAIFNELLSGSPSTSTEEAIEDLFGEE